MAQSEVYQKDIVYRQVGGLIRHAASKIWREIGGPNARQSTMREIWFAGNSVVCEDLQ